MAKILLGADTHSLTSIQAHFWDFLEIACWYWPDLAKFQADKHGISRINLNFRQERGFQENSSLSDSMKIHAQC